MVKKHKLILLGIIVLMIPIVMATPNTKLSLVNDSADGVNDMVGPESGFVNYNQNNAGDLRTVVKMEGGEPLTTYTIYLVCGPTHAAACGFISIGTLTTDVNGNGNSGAIRTPVATLQSAPFGSGARTDHIDAISGPDVHAAAILTYTVP